MIFFYSTFHLPPFFLKCTFSFWCNSLASLYVVNGKKHYINKAYYWNIIQKPWLLTFQKHHQCREKTIAITSPCTISWMDRKGTLAWNLLFIFRPIWIISEISSAAFLLQFDMRNLWRYVGGWLTQWSGTSPSYAMATVLSAQKQPPSHMLLSLLVTDRQAVGYAYRMPCKILIYCAALHNSEEEMPYFSLRMYRSTSSDPRTNF